MMGRFQPFLFHVTFVIQTAQIHPVFAVGPSSVLCPLELKFLSFLPCCVQGFIDNVRLDFFMDGQNLEHLAAEMFRVTKPQLLTVANIM